MSDKYALNGVCVTLGDEEGHFIDEQFDSIKRDGVILRVYPKPKGSSEIDIYSTSKRTLSSNIPILANIGFAIEAESSFSIKKDESTIYIQKYFLDLPAYKELKNSRVNIEEVLNATLKDERYNTPLNALAYKINIDLQSIEILEALSAYAKQLVADFSSSIITTVLLKYYHIANLFLHYFCLKFDKNQKNRLPSMKEAEQKIASAIKGVENINEDRVLSCFFALIRSITRTNLFALKEGSVKDSALAFKIDVAGLSDFTDGIQPRFEIFVFHRLFEGVHLRRNSVARGGIRWSDRLDDYRNEVRLLMQAQRQKNSIIVPTGAKGGFVIKQSRVGKDDFLKYYKLYINSLLDMIDNKIGEETVKNPNILHYDGNDTYFVVAADKGTSGVSDVANVIAKGRGFWLDDAFASGGSMGYNHKEMGITAKGAIKSVERFFVEIGKNIYKERISVIGIGSPAGDVFGNGMLLSESFALIGAVSSKELFIDPNPDVKKAFTERKRLFEGNLGWSAYDRSLISEGGGVFKKSDKEILLSKEIKTVLGIKKDTLNGEELTRHLLCAKVDMLFNGGVGTYVKASFESSAEVGDKPNASVRVNAKDIRAFAVCEGGNLGFSQKARIEFAKKGGKISADSIDNSGGVQTSDYEVNLKIILNSLINKSIITQDRKLEILKALASDVESIVLKTNYDQALSLSLDGIRSRGYTERIKESLSVLEEGVDSFRREHFDIPGAEEFERAFDSDGRVLRPMLSVMLSFSKIFLKSFLLKEREFLASEFTMRYLYAYFPSTFVALYRVEVENHPLKGEIIATYISNKIINAKGSTFIYDFKRLNRDEFLLRIKSFLVVDELISASIIREEIAKEELNLGARAQYELLLELEGVIEFLCDWIETWGEQRALIFDHLLEYKRMFEEFMLSLEAPKKISIGEHSDRFFANSEFFKTLLNIIVIKEQRNESFRFVAELFFEAISRLGIVSLIDGVKALKPTDRWEEEMQKELQKELFESVANIVKEVLEFRRSSENVKEAFDAYIENKKRVFEKYSEEVKTLKSEGGNLGFSSLFMVINSLKRLA